MNWLSIIAFLVVGLISLIQKAAKESGGSGRKQPPFRPPQAGGPTPLPPWFQTGQAIPPPEPPMEEEGLTLEGSLSALLKGEDATETEEGYSLEGAALDEPVAAEIHEEAVEPARQTGELLTEPDRQSGDDFALNWEEPFALVTDEIEESAPGAATPAGRAWLSKREDLVRTVLAAEVLGRPGGWRQRRAFRQRV